MYGQYNPNFAYGVYPNMQNRLGNFDSQFNKAPTYLKGRMVTSIDEAKASQFDLDGSITFFPSLAENKIYAKTLDNNGLPMFLQFVIQPEMPQPKAIDVEGLAKRIERLERELGYDSDGIDSSDANK